MPRLGRSQDAYDRFSAAVALPLTILALIWLPVLVVPIVVRLSTGLATLFAAVDYFVWAAFAIEYGVKLYLTPRRRNYVTHHVIELAMVVLPILRPLRAFRLLRILSGARAALVLANVLRRLRGMLTHHGLHYALLVVLGVVVVCAALTLNFESGAPGSNIQNFGDALWWAIVTVTTVGYGDKIPVTPEGRGVAVVLMIVGIGLIGLLTATVASFLVGEAADKETASLNARLTRIEGMLTQVLGHTVEADSSGVLRNEATSQQAPEE